MENNFYEEYHDNSTITTDYAVADTAMALVKVFLWMFAGVALSFLTAFICQKILIQAILNNQPAVLSGFIVAMVISFVVELILCFTINKNAANALKVNKAIAGFIAFSILNGISLSTVFFLLDAAILYQVLASVSIYFLALAGFTALFRKKLTTLWSFAGVGLLTLLVVSGIISLYSIFALSTMTNETFVFLYLGVSILGIIVFTIMTIADMNRIKSIITDTGENQKGAIISGAFILYLDFINILIYVIRIVVILGGGRRKN